MNRKLNNNVLNEEQAQKVIEKLSLKDDKDNLITEDGTVPITEVIKQKEGEELKEEVNNKYSIYRKSRTRFNKVDPEIAKPVDIPWSTEDKRRYAIMKHLGETNTRLEIEEFVNYTDDDGFFNGEVAEIVRLIFITFNNGLKQEMINLNILPEDAKGFQSSHAKKWLEHFYNIRHPDVFKWVGSTINSQYDKVEKNKRRNGGINLILKDGSTYIPSNGIEKLNLEQFKMIINEGDKALTAHQIQEGIKAINSLPTKLKEDKIKIDDKQKVEEKEPVQQKQPVENLPNDEPESIKTHLKELKDMLIERIKKMDSDVLLGMFEDKCNISELDETTDNKRNITVNLLNLNFKL